MNSHQLRQLTAAILLMMLYGLYSVSFGLFQGPITVSLGCSRASFNLCYTILSVVNIFTVPVIGRFLRRFPTRYVLFSGGLLGSLGFLIFSFCTQVQMFYWGAIILGLVQHGTTSVAAVLLVNRAFPVNNGTPTGIAMAGTGFCSMLASLTIPTVIETWGWQTSYRLLAVFWLTVLFIAGLLSDDLSNPTPSDEPAASPHVLPGATYSQALRSPYLYAFMFSFFLLSLNTIFYQHLPSFFTDIGYSATEAGQIMGIYSVALIFCKISLGVMFDRLGAGKTVILIYLGYAASLWMFLTGNKYLLFLGIPLIAYGMATANVLMPLLAKEIFGIRDFPPVWSLLSVAMLSGNAIGAPLWGMIYDRAGSYRAAVALSPVLIIANAVFLLLLLRHSVHAP